MNTLSDYEYEVYKKHADKFFDFIEDNIKKLSIDDPEFKKDAEVLAHYLVVTAFIMQFPKEVLPRVLELEGMMANLSAGHKMMKTS